VWNRIAIASRYQRPGFAYVAEGAVKSQVGDEPPVVYTAGESWYEPPLMLHRAENASATAPARLVAFFVCDRPGPVTVPVKTDSSVAGAQRGAQ
jgi:quercetin dioxygenase-like cupin family protein